MKNFNLLLTYSCIFGVCIVLERVPMDRWNWLLHTHYTRHDSESCRALIARLEQETNGLCEYAHYVRGLILREEGRVQESVDSFQQCVLLNPNSMDNLKQVARSLYDLAFSSKLKVI